MAKIRINKRFRWVLSALVVVLLVGGIAAGLHIHSVHKAQHVSGTIPTSKKTKSTGSAKTKSQQAASSVAGPAAPDNQKLPGSAVSTSTVLAAPFGSFVSNHRPGQGGSPTTEQSTCNTTPGATCDIQFTNGSGVVKSLGAETVDGNGTAYWSWNVDGGTIAPGSWQITAVVKLNGQTKTATDPTPLEVQ